MARIVRMQAGNRGDWKPVGAGVFELRIDHGLGYRVYCGQDGRALVLCGGDKRTQAQDIEDAHVMTTGKTTKRAASVEFDAANYLRPEDVPGFLAEALHDGDYRVLPLALRAAADVLGMAELAALTGLSRETLYRTLSEKGNPRLDTLAAILSAFGLRLAVAPLPRPRQRTNTHHLA
jgi:putative addiction module killer protein/probable addiction module antidote protein